MNQLGGEVSIQSDVLVFCLQFKTKKTMNKTAGFLPEPIEFEADSAP
jgi:hypothetical protein